MSHIKLIDWIVPALWVVLSSAVGAEDKLLPVVDEIRAEAARPTINDVGWPLPLAGHWNEMGFPPTYQLELIAKGHYLLPWFNWPPTGEDVTNNFPKDAVAGEKWYKTTMTGFEAPIKKAAELKLPISFLATQWECLLSYGCSRNYIGLPPELNPNVVTTNGTILPQVDAFGPIGPWKEVGDIWTDNRGMKQLEEWYPNPPLVMFISNNEHGKGTEKRYLDLYGKDKDEDFRRRVVAAGFAERYKALIQAMKDGLAAPEWKKNALFMGYEAFGGVSHFGREFPPDEVKSWKAYSGYYKGRMFGGASAVWDGGSPSYYLHNWSFITDFKVWSPQLEAMNWVFALKEELAINSKYWFEFSTWDGNVGFPTDKRLTYLAMGQTLSPERYGGMIQFGMWLMRPRVVRDFRGSNESRVAIEPYFIPIMEAVDRVHTNPILRKFWRKGELVANHAHQHPYNNDIPDDYKNTDRWFLLDTDLDNPWPWNKFTEVPVFSLALVMGKAPEREWLVYTHAPKGARLGVKITVPEYGPITVDSPQAGSFYLVSEKAKRVTPVVVGGPASVGIDLKSRFVKRGEKIAVKATDPYGTQGNLTRFAWDFGDGKQDSGAMVEHAYKQDGQYALSLKASNGKGEQATKDATVFVGVGPEDGLVLHYLMTKSAGEIMADASGRDHVGFLTNTRWVDDPKRGASLAFNGTNSCVLLLNTSDINTAIVTNRTIALWFNSTGTTNRQMVYEEGGPGAGLNIYLENGKLNGGAWAVAAWKGTWLTAADGIETGKWYHVALVLKDAPATVAPDKLMLYLNGAKVGTGQAAQIPAHTADICIGRSGNTLYPTGAANDAGDYFAGQMQDFSIYNRALSDKEIKRLAK